MKTVVTRFINYLSSFKKINRYSEEAFFFTEIEKKQIMEAYNAGYRDGESNQCFSNPTQFEDVSNFSNAENYYNETFKK